MIAYCDVRLAKEGVIGLRPRNLRGFDGGAIRGAASVALGTPLLISSQAVAVPMEETLALGADDWMGSNADGTGAPVADGPRVHLDVPRPNEKKPEMQVGVGSSGRRKGGLCSSHSASWVSWVGFEDLRPKAASPRGTPREGSEPYVSLECTSTSGRECCRSVIIMVIF